MEPRKDLLTRINQGMKTLHNEAHDRVYLRRYHADDLTLLDHYRHLCQLKPIYAVLKEKMNHADFSFELPSGLRYLLDRTAELDLDLQFLAPHVTNTDKDMVLASTRTYVQNIENLKPCADDPKILAHFLTRILGDMFGGQGMKKAIGDLYDRKELHRDDSLAGLNFYCFEADALKDLCRWVRAIEVSDLQAKTIVDTVNDSLRYHIEIFNELESTRDTGIINSITKSCHGFFKQHGTTIAGYGAAAIVLGVSAVLTAEGQLKAYGYK